MTHHQYGIFVLISQMSFRWETSGDVAKCRLFAQVIVSHAATFVSSHNVPPAGSKVQVAFHRSRVQVTAPLINYQTTQIPLNLDYE